MSYEASATHYSSLTRHRFDTPLTPEANGFPPGPGGIILAALIITFVGLIAVQIGYHGVALMHFGVLDKNPLHVIGGAALIALVFYFLLKGNPFDND